MLTVKYELTKDRNSDSRALQSQSRKHHTQWF